MRNGKDRLLTLKQAGERLHYSTDTVRRLIRERNLVGLKLRGALRVLESSLELYIDRCINNFDPDF